MSRVYFTDRDLGKQFPAILRSAGLFVEEHSDHFVHNMPDDAWLPVVAKRGWVVLTHNERIRYTPNERDAVMQNGLAMLIVTGKAPYPVLAQSLVRMMSKVEGFLGTGRH